MKKQFLIIVSLIGLSTAIPAMADGGIRAHHHNNNRAVHYVDRNHNAVIWGFSLNINPPVRYIDRRIIYNDRYLGVAKRPHRHEFHHHHKYYKRYRHVHHHHKYYSGYH